MTSSKMKAAAEFAAKLHAPVYYDRKAIYPSESGYKVLTFDFGIVVSFKTAFSPNVEKTMMFLNKTRNDLFEMGISANIYGEGCNAELRILAANNAN